MGAHARGRRTSRYVRSVVGDYLHATLVVQEREHAALLKLAAWWDKRATEHLGSLIPPLSLLPLPAPLLTPR